MFMFNYNMFVFKVSKIHMFMFGYGIVCVHNGVFIYS